METLNSDLGVLVVADLAKTAWVRSPGGAVVRQMLEGEAPESGRSTSIVRLFPGASFPEHPHPGGEEFTVLEGTLSDEHGDYGAGTYIRNPVGSPQAPFSRTGCRLFAKLGQVVPEGSRLVLPSEALAWRFIGGGMSVATLYVDERERVDWLRAERTLRVAMSDAELLVLDGALRFEARELSAMTWMRIPYASSVELEIVEGTRLWRKRGHLGRPGWPHPESIGLSRR